MIHTFGSFETQIKIYFSKSAFFCGWWMNTNFSYKVFWCERFSVFSCSRSSFGKKKGDVFSRRDCLWETLVLYETKEPKTWQGWSKITSKVRLHLQILNVFEVKPQHGFSLMSWCRNKVFWRNFFNQFCSKDETSHSAELHLKWTASDDVLCSVDLLISP